MAPRGRGFLSVASTRAKPGRIYGWPQFRSGQTFLVGYLAPSLFKGPEWYFMVRGGPAGHGDGRIEEFAKCYSMLGGLLASFPVCREPGAVAAPGDRGGRSLVDLSYYIFSPGHPAWASLCTLPCKIISAIRKGLVPGPLTKKKINGQI